MAEQPAPRSKQKAVDRRAARLLEKAQEVFLEFGYAGASMELIADRAEISRRTIYNYFPSKEALVTRIVQHTSNRVIEVIDSFEDRSASAEDQLTSYCRAMVAELIRPEHLTAYRLLVEVAHLFPDLARGLRTSTTDAFVAGICSHLDDLVARGLLEIEDTREASLLLIAVAMLPVQRFALGVDDKASTDPDWDRFVADAVKMFCSHHRPRRSEPPPKT